jgi:hypothetical protein
VRGSSKGGSNVTSGHLVCRAALTNDGVDRRVLNHVNPLNSFRLAATSLDIARALLRE